MAKKGLPKTVFVTVRELQNDEPYLAAERSAEATMEDDGPTVVGTYKLVEVRTLTKEVVITAPRKPKRRSI